MPYSLNSVYPDFSKFEFSRFYRIIRVLIRLIRLFRPPTSLSDRFASLINSVSFEYPKCIHVGYSHCINVCFVVIIYNCPLKISAELPLIMRTCNLIEPETKKC